MNIIGAILFAGIGIVWFLAASRIRRKSTDYTGYPVTEGTVLHTENFAAERWTASFCIGGEEVLGMDDRFAASTFKPEKYHIPKCRTQESIYYWKRTEQDLRSGHYGINGKPVEYYFHFCVESFYELRDRKEKNAAIRYRILGMIFIFLGILIFLQ
ncbi:MAG: hypothetical protein LUE31_00935 [Lachnospiraceae bacterium]|nr:hypothetical protein [Lachnospiraceae bacterium]